MRKLLIFGCAAVLAAAAGCGSSRGQGDDSDSGAGDGGVDASTDPDAGPGADADHDSGTIDPGPLGYIGSPCETVADCNYQGAVCLTDGFPDGICTMACDQFCPDQDGYPMTFCVEAADLPPAAAALGDGACFARCNFLYFPDTGCRAGYGCVAATRANEPGVELYVCLPNVQSELGQCYYDLAARDVGFEPTIRADDHPSTHPNLTCHIEDPLYLFSPLHGVELQNYGGTETPRVLTACNMAHALTSTIDDVIPHGVDALRHMGTYNCRVIAGTDTLSRHAFADAIDIGAFHFTDDTLYTLFDHWEHNTTNPQTPGGIFLYEAAHRWFDDWIWNIILTPNYNTAHDDHFHVDLTPSSHFIGFRGWRYIGPAPYVD
jgi:hypothetical protein